MKQKVIASTDGMEGKLALSVLTNNLYTVEKKFKGKIKKNKSTRAKRMTSVVKYV